MLFAVFTITITITGSLSPFFDQDHEIAKRSMQGLIESPKGPHTDISHLSVRTVTCTVFRTRKNPYRCIPDVEGIYLGHTLGIHLNATTPK